MSNGMGLARRIFLLMLGMGLSWVSLQGQEKKDNLTVLQTYKGHGEAIYAIAVSPDDQLLATASFDKSVKLFATATGKEVRTYAGTAGHQNLVLSVDFSKDGLQVASGGSDNFARVWDVPASRSVRDFAHPAGVTSLVGTADGKQIVGSVTDGSIHIWQSVDGKKLHQFPGHAGGSTALSLGNNGQTLASVGKDGLLRFWNMADGKQISAIGGHTGSINGVAIHPGNNTVFTIGEDGFLKFWQLPVVASRSFPGHSEAVTRLTLSNDANQLISSSSDKVVKLSNVANGQLIRELTGATAEVQATAISANHATVAAGCKDGKVHVWNAADGKLLYSVLAHVGGVTGVGFHPGQPILFSTGADGMVRSWSLPIGGSRSLNHPDVVTASILSGDGKRLFTGSADKIIRAWNISNGQLERQFTGHGGSITTLALSNDGNTLISASQDETIRLWNPNNGQEMARWSGHSGAIRSLSLAPQNNLLASAGEDGFKLWTLPAVPPKLLTHPEAVTSLLLSPDGSRVLTVGEDKQVRCWTLNNSQIERTHAVNNQPIVALALAADGQTLALADAEKNITLFKEGKEIKKFSLPDVPTAILLRPNAANLYVALKDNTIRMFDINEAKEIKKIEGHTGKITQMLFSPQGDFFVSASEDKTVRLWNEGDAADKGKIDLPSAVVAVSLNKEGNQLAIAGTDKAITVWNLNEKKQLASFQSPTDVKGLALHPNLARIALACVDHKVRILGFDGRLQEQFQQEAAVTAVVWGADGKQLLSSSADKTVRIWHSAWVNQVSGSATRQVTFHPQGNVLLTSADDGALRIWEVGKWQDPKTIPAHGAAIIGFGISADGSKVATASADKSAKVWNLADGKMLSSISLAGPSQRLAFSPNGTRLGIVSQREKMQRLQVFDANTGRELQTWMDLPTNSLSLVFAADNRTLIHSGEDKQAMIFDVSVNHAFLAHAGGATGLEVHPNGSQLITSGNDKTIRLWQSHDGKDVRTFGPLKDRVQGLTVSRDWIAIAGWTGKTIQAFQHGDGKELFTIQNPAEIVSAAFHGDRSRLVLGGTDNQARIWDLPTNRQVGFFPSSGTVTALVVHPNQPLVLIGSSDKSVVGQTFSLQRSIAVSPNPLRAMTITSNGSHVLVGGEDKLIRAYNIGNGNEERKWEGHDGPVHALAVSRNGQLLASGGSGKTVHLYAVNDTRQWATINTSAAIKSLAFHPNNNSLAVGLEDLSLVVYNIMFQPGQPLPPEFGKPIQIYPHGGAVTTTTFTDTGALFSGSLDQTIRQWRLASDVPTKNFQHPNLVDCVAFDTTGNLLATGCHDGNLRIWDLPKNTPIKTINAHVQPQPNPIYCVAWSPDNKQIVTGSNDKSLKLWDANGGNLIREFKPFKEKEFEKGHRDQVFCVAFNKQGNQMASGSSDRTIKLWNVADGSVIREFINPNIKQPASPEPQQAHPGWVYSLKFTADDQFLISVGSAPKNRGYIAIWQVNDGKLLYASEMTAGPIFGMALSKDGKQLHLACGPKVRQKPDSEAVTISLPK